jgi:hypothetical protein
MKVIIALVMSVVSSVAFADEAYQLKNIVGSWKTQEGPYAYEDMLITLSPDHPGISMVECDPWNLEMSGTCVRKYEYSATGSFSDATGSMQMSEGPGSPNSNFALKVDENNPDKVLRTWGSVAIEYFRVQ